MKMPWPTPSPNLNINQYSIEDIAILEVEGIVNQYSAHKLRDALTNVFKTGNYRVVVDLEALEDDDEADYIAVLVGGAKRARYGGGSLRLVCTNQVVIDTFLITGLDKSFKMYPTIKKAVDAFHESKFTA